MALFLVAYDFNKETSGKDRDTVRELLTDDCGETVKLSESCYAFKSATIKEKLFDKFKPHLDSNDSLAIIEFNLGDCKSTLDNDLMRLFN